MLRRPEPEEEELAEEVDTKLYCVCQKVRFRHSRSLWTTGSLYQISGHILCAAG
jgi:hypothetical protein